MPVNYHGEEEAESRVMRGLRLAVELAIVALLLEAAGAFFSRSLALTVDAVHDAPDILAFGVSWAALRATSHGTSEELTFGAHRFEVFAGLLNATLILGTGLVFGYEALSSLLFHSLFAGPVDPLWILAVALPTLSLRGITTLVLRRVPGKTRDLNLRSVILHLLGDFAIAGVLLLVGVALLVRPSLWWADALGALAISGVLVVASLPLFREGWEVITERAPRGVSVDAITRAALTVPGVSDVHDVHVWSVCSSLLCMTAHVGVRDMSLQDSAEVTGEIRRRLQDQFGILHSTIEIEAEPRT